MGEVNSKSTAQLERRAVVSELLKDRGDLLLVTGLGSPSYDAMAAGDNPANFYLWGAMGSSVTIGLGLALAQPDRPVMVLTGDGELLMGLGALATAGFGTALGVIRAAVNAGKRIQVLADETRPFLQGARLTVWELMEDKIPVKLITDNMSGFFMKNKKVDAVVVGADRIAANGDVANKIGTYMVAVLAQKHQIPFYVAAPISTIDLSISSGEKIPIEERSEDEVTSLNNKRITPEGATAAHPAFDITPNDLITAIITDRGIAKPQYTKSLKYLSKK